MMKMSLKTRDVHRISWDFMGISGKLFDDSWSGRWSLWRSDSTARLWGTSERRGATLVCASSRFSILLAFQLVMFRYPNSIQQLEGVFFWGRYLQFQWFGATPLMETSTLPPGWPKMTQDDPRPHRLAKVHSVDELGQNHRVHMQPARDWPVL